MISLFIFQENLRILRAKYPTQSDYFWTKILTCFERSSKEGAKTEILLIINDDSTTDDPSFDIMTAISAAIQNKFINNLNISEKIKISDYTTDNPSLDTLSQNNFIKVKSYKINKKNESDITKNLQNLKKMAVLNFNIGFIDKDEKEELINQVESGKLTADTLFEFLDWDIPSELESMNSRIGNNVLIV